MSPSHHIARTRRYLTYAVRKPPKATSTAPPKPSPAP